MIPTLKAGLQTGKSLPTAHGSHPTAHVISLDFSGIGAILNKLKSRQEGLCRIETVFAEMQENVSVTTPLWGWGKKPNVSPKQSRGRKLYSASKTATSAMFQ